MIIFHEGLPGSGKSYEAMVTRIVPALAKGRAVVAYVECLDVDKIASLAGIEPDQCRQLLKPITRDQVQSRQADPRTGKELVIDHLPDLAQDNALIVLDEAQNFWGNRARLGPQMTEFVTEHRHRGIDIVLMGQDLRDVHATWRRRVELKLCFLKLNGFGKLMAKRYSCTTYRHLGGDQFQRVGLQVNKYDPRYFGSYASHVADDTNTADYEDNRGSAVNAPLMKYGIPLALVLGLAGLWHAYRFFSPESSPVASSPPGAPGRAAAAASAPAPGRPLTVTQAPLAQSPVVAAQDQRSAIERRLVDLAGKGRIRLAGLVSMGSRTSGIVEWVQGGSVVVERLTLDALRTLGVAVLISGDAVQLAVGDYAELATAWPLEDPGRATNATQVAVRGPQPLGASPELPQGLAAAAQPPSFRELPGALERSETVGSAIRRAATP